jgi:hypothetical protein
MSRSILHKITPETLQSRIAHHRVPRSLEKIDFDCQQAGIVL